MEVTILDPDLDPDGRIIESFVGFLEEAFIAGPTRIES
jgi:hypothetical protein